MQDTCPNQDSQDLYSEEKCLDIQGFMIFLSWNVMLWTLRKNLISAAYNLDSTHSVITQDY